MVVYVEAVLFDNFCLDSLLAYLTVTLSGKKTRAVFLIISAFLGCLFALFFPLIPQPVLPVYKAASLFICSFAFCGVCSVREYAVNTFLYLLLSFLLSGILSFLLGGTKNGLIGVSFGGAVGVLCLSGLVLLYAARQVRGLIRQAKHREKRVVAEVINRDKTIKIGALYDSGNLLTDANGKGVVVSDERKLAALGELSSVGEMKVDTASGSKVLRLVKIPKIKIYSKDGENILTNVTAALSDLPDEYALILPCE